MNPKSFPYPAPAAGTPGRPQVSFTASAIDVHEAVLDLHAYVVRHPTATFFFRAGDGSMQDVGIFPGDLLAVDRSLPPLPGKVVVACVEGELVLRQIVRRRGRLWLAAADPRFRPLLLAEEADYVIWGVVTHSIHTVQAPAG